MWWNNKPILNIVDTETDSEHAIFIKDKTAGSLWTDFVNVLVTICTGSPEPIIQYQESSFASAQLKTFSEEVRINLQFSVIKAPKSIEQGERYHHPLRRTSNIINDTNPDIYDNSKPLIAINVMKDTMEPEGLVPSLLLFGFLPSLPVQTIFNKNPLHICNGLQIARA